MKKIVSLLFIISLALSVISCENTSQADNTNPAATTLSGVQSTTEGEEDYFSERRKVEDDIPDIDFDGEEVKILHFNKYIKFVMADEEVGEVVNDAVYQANMKINDRFNTKITYVGEALDEIGIIDYMKKSISAGDDSFDFAFGHDLLTPALSLEGYFVNLYDMKYLNFDKPWWNKAALEEYTIMDQCYLGISSMSYMGLARSRVLLLNEDKIKDLGLALPYDDVINGTWTLDKLIGITKDVYQDVNGNDKRDDGDFFGYISEGSCYGYLDNFDIDIMGRDDDGLINVGFEMNKMTTLIQKLYDWLCESDGAYISDDGNHFPIDEFVNNEVLFARAQIDEAIDKLKGSNISYGIVPMPKYDKNQENYITSCGEFVMVVPTTLSDEKLDNISAVIEAMSAEGYKEIFPAYFKVALQTKYFDNQSIKMLDIINESRRSSFSFVYDGGVGMSYTIYNMMCKGVTSNPSSDFTSYYGKKEAQLENQIKKLNEAFVKLAG